LTLKGFEVCAWIAASSARSASSPSMAQGSEPKPPALQTAMASALPWTPAIGAWMIGSSMPRRALREVIASAIAERRQALDRLA
jgi:hypothetical protein